MEAASGGVHATAGGEDLEVTAEMAVVGGHEVDRAVQVLGVVPVDEALDPGDGGGDVCEGARGEVGRYLRVRKRASEYGLSLLTRGRLKEGSMPRVFSFFNSGSLFIAAPLSECSQRRLLHRGDILVGHHIPAQPRPRGLLLPVPGRRSGPVEASKGRRRRNPR